MYSDSNNRIRNLGGGSRRLRGISALKLYLLCLGGVWLLLLLARAAFAVYALDSFAGADQNELFRAFYIGGRFDARLAAILTFPLGLLLTIPWLGRRLAGWANAMGLFYFLVFLAVWLVYALDFGFHAYLGIRLNATLFELLEDFGVSLDMVWESYPVIFICLGLLLAAFCSALLMRGLCAKEVKPCWSLPGRIFSWLAGFVIFALAAYGQVSSNLFPLRWSNAYFSPNPAVSALALNPLQNLYDTYRASNDEGFSLEAAREAYPLMAEFLLVDKSDAVSLNYARRHAGLNAAGAEQTALGQVGIAQSANHPNVVIIIMESMGHPKSSFAPGNADPTPFLKSLAAESLYYPNFYANTRTTARAIFTIMTGIPDVTESSTASRNQLIVDQRLIAAEFSGYDKYYMIGGNTNWANIRGILSNNIGGLSIMEESSWQAPNVDVWGISDYDLLREAHQFFLSRGEKPFLAVIQTASLHAPYTVPDDLPGFEKKELSKEDQHNYGFESEDEYNSMRFADYSLAEFFRLAKASDYYRDTIFVLLGDHGIRDSNGNMDAAYTAADLAPWHVPLILHAPGRLDPGVDAEPASQVDVFPTVASLAGASYTNWTLGRDLLDTRFSGSRAAFIGGQLDTPIRLRQGDYCYFDNRAGRLALYRLGDPLAQDFQSAQPARFKRMRALAEAMQVTAKYMLYNNKK
ncbi:MAG: sulfatase-like hydrolase/transferase [Deltaproteobacteria bacterium]|jgi:phosphoglycerol transferase MdoB-like AlkP superfamily enzyme|nr:sulfatase-like hydrolase/transferase [Deltaproteobacteria bacterium]